MPISPSKVASIEEFCGHVLTAYKETEMFNSIKDIEISSADGNFKFKIYSAENPIGDLSISALIEKQLVFNKGIISL